MATSRKHIRSTEVPKTLESGDYDDISVPEFDDSCSEGEEPVISDVVICGDTKLDICDVACQWSSSHLDPCFKDSLLLDDVEVNSSSDDSDVENCNSAAGTDEDTDTAKVPTATANSSETARQNWRPYAAVSRWSRACTVFFLIC